MEKKFAKKEKNNTAFSPISTLLSKFLSALLEVGLPYSPKF